jgi:WD40 repeat protein
VAWSPDGTVIATGNGDGTRRLFDAVGGVPVGDPIVTGDAATWAVAWSPDGTVIATGNVDGTMRLFDAVSSDPIGDPVVTGDGATSVVAWSPDGTIIATGNGDGTMRLFSSWSESEACAYLRKVMTAEQMDHLIGIEGGRSRCAHEQVDDLQPIPVLRRPLPK